MKPLALVALLLAGCAQPAPFFPKPAEPAPMAATVPPAKAQIEAVTGTASGPRAAAGELRPVGQSKDESCASGWTLPEILSTLAAAAIFAWALLRLYRAKADKA